MLSRVVGVTVACGQGLRGGEGVNPTVRWTKNIPVSVDNEHKPQGESTLCTLKTRSQRGRSRVSDAGRTKRSGQEAIGHQTLEGPGGLPGVCFHPE